jgi:hypothetical protein
MEELVQRQNSREGSEMEKISKGSKRNNENRSKQMHSVTIVTHLPEFDL